MATIGFLDFVFDSLDHFRSLRDGMVQILIKAPIKKVMEVYSNMDVWKHWNPYVNSRLIEKVNESSKVCGVRFRDISQFLF